jgi:hypothetical protein
VLAAATVVFRDVEHLPVTVPFPVLDADLLHVRAAAPSRRARMGGRRTALRNFVTPPLLAIRDPLFFGRLPSGGDTAYTIGQPPSPRRRVRLPSRDDQLAAAL